MHIMRNISAFLGLLASIISVSPETAFAGDKPNDWTPDPNLFYPPRIYITPSPTALTYTTPSPNGIPYRWLVTPEKTQVNFSYYVGSKSWWEPANYDANPSLPGWTHNTNWIALNLKAKSWVTIEVGPAAPMPCAPPSQPAACDSTGRTGSDIYPAISLYRGYDTTSPQDHVFNPRGSFWAKRLRYISSSSQSDPVTHVLKFRKLLPAGVYTINIGGAAAISPYCSQSAPCYTGGKSYQATINAEPVPF
jgi:hypothetical protein